MGGRDPAIQCKRCGRHFPPIRGPLTEVPPLARPPCRKQTTLSLTHMPLLTSPAFTSKCSFSPLTHTIFTIHLITQNVDYIGLDLGREHLLFYASSPEALRDLKVRGG